MLYSNPIRFSDEVVQELRSKVSSVRPTQSLINPKRRKINRITESLEHFPRKFRREIRFAFKPIVEFQPDAMASPITSLENVSQHKPTPVVGLL
jgi:hypothetical protein